MKKDAYIELKTNRDRADWGHRNLDGQGADYRSVLVEPDGTVRALDSVSGTYTLCHSLTAAEQDEARRIASEK